MDAPQLDLFAEGDEGQTVTLWQRDVLPKLSAEALAAIEREEEEELERAFPNPPSGARTTLRRQPRLTVRPIYKESCGRRWTHSELRIRGLWLQDIFPPGTKVQITREERRGKVALVIEEIEEV